MGRVAHVKVGRKNEEKYKKNNPKSIINGTPRWMASWHRFLMNFNEFWDASWHLNSHKNRSQEALNKECQIVSILDLIFGRLRGFQKDLGGDESSGAGKFQVP